jgi:ribonuclease Z
LAVNPVEVLPATPTVEPVYKDENISVYAVPITSSSLETETDNAPPSALPRASKRKRTPSPIASSKRPTHDHPAASPRGGPAGILETIRLKGLSPAELEGELAREWRRHMVRETFSGVHAPKKPPRGRTGNAGIGPSVKPREHNSDAPGPSSTGGGTIELGGRDTKAALGFFHPLPRLEPPLAQARDHRMTTCLAYAVVGPLLRGKFSEERAKALGLPDGQIRSRLARGETVSFTVDDGQGGKVERTVRPEDCISKSDGRGVRYDRVLRRLNFYFFSSCRCSWYWTLLRARISLRCSPRSALAVSLLSFVRKTAKLGRTCINTPCAPFSTSAATVYWKILGTGHSWTALGLMFM